MTPKRIVNCLNMSNKADNTSTSSTASSGDASLKKDTPTHNASETVPQLDGITFGELQTCVKVLTAVAALAPKKQKKRQNQDTQEEEQDNLLQNYKHTNLRPLRKALSQCLELHQRTMYNGKTESEFYKQRIEERTLKRQKCAERDKQRNYIATTALRKGRIDRLNQKALEAKDEEMAKLQLMMMIPDGHVETVMEDDDDDDEETTVKLLTNQESNETNESLKEASTSNGVENKNDDPIQLPMLRSCYVCKTRYRQLHAFYDQLCPSCAALNWEKRHQTCNLQNKVAVVTGSRVKIGFQTCLKLLRAGGTVVATTRFPNSAAAAYRKEADFQTWKDRLQLYGLDLRDVTGIEAFCRFLKMHYSKCGLDILINNACQTVRRPTAYYLPACQQEEELWQKGDATHRNLLTGCVEFERVRRKLLLDHKQMAAAGGGNQNKRLEASSAIPMLANSGNSETKQEKAASETALTTTTSTSGTKESAAAPFESTGMSHSAAMSQMILLPEDVGISDAVLPPGVTDINGQQLDLRSTNSWLLRMEEVSTPEVMECMFINAIAPFVLNSRLKPLMCVPNPHPDRYIINVSAMEGKFYRYKMANHPHTNMAKAALNMMTRTSAEDLATKHHIYMNSVDTGWINDENPLEKAAKTAKVNQFQTPIDEIDAAARILDPIFTGMNKPEQAKEYGKFLKDYRETEW